MIYLKIYNIYRFGGVMLNLFRKIKSLLDTDKVFFDKEATIKEYFALVPPEKRRRVNDYDELYQEALKFVEKQDFVKNTANLDDYFHEISKDEGMVAVFLGIIAYGVAKEVDKNGSEIEQAIDKMLPKDYDVNNPFDVKKGYGHRIFGHDPATFGMKNIPGDLLIQVKDSVTGKYSPIRIGEFLGKGISSNVSMWDLIWKFYGNNKTPLKGIINALSHTIIHFAKDLFTPAGLPLPFVSLFNEYQKYMNMGKSVSTIKYQDSFMYKMDNQKINMKASDFASYFLIESFLYFYCEYTSNSKGITDRKGFKQDMKLISMGTCISLQMSTIVLGNELQVGKRGNKSMIPGGKVNVLMTGTFFKVALQDMGSILKARHKINESYKTKYMEDYYNG